MALINQAKGSLEILESDGEISLEDAGAAAEEMTGLFELFQDDDVLDMFEMEEPADAALARHDPVNQQLGVADQRIEAWFDPVLDDERPVCVRFSTQLVLMESCADISTLGPRCYHVRK